MAYNIISDIEEAKERYAQDEIDIDTFENEVEFWMRFGGETCDLCRPDQMCASHYEKFYGGYC